jgi:hypothetical protein
MNKGDGREWKGKKMCAGEWRDKGREEGRGKWRKRRMHKGMEENGKG